LWCHPGGLQPGTPGLKEFYVSKLPGALLHKTTCHCKLRKAFTVLSLFTLAKCCTKPLFRFYVFSKQLVAYTNILSQGFIEGSLYVQEFPAGDRRDDMRSGSNTMYMFDFIEA